MGRNWTLERMEASMSPERIPMPEPAKIEHGKDGPYWRSGFVTALTEAACNRTAALGRESYIRLPAPLAKIPWC